MFTIIPHSMLTLITFPVLYSFFFFLGLIIAFTFYLISYVSVVNSSSHFFRNGNSSGQIHTYQVMSQIHFLPLAVISLGENYPLTTGCHLGHYTTVSLECLFPITQEVPFAPLLGWIPDFLSFTLFFWLGLFPVLV